MTTSPQPPRLEQEDLGHHLQMDEVASKLASSSSYFQYSCPGLWPSPDLLIRQGKATRDVEVSRDLLKSRLRNPRPKFPWQSNPSFIANNRKLTTRCHRRCRTKNGKGYFEEARGDIATNVELLGFVNREAG
ncbi:uncharacterized protein A4U43_C04F28110 [Asparagus officinalis]|uniref:Uncharacterized protein n=1 Tax=Asparagus officinalis TaxID=4686 RepID=A0A5P1F955_ASPOF|nr:uncharacterized protein A4U43_C04F28110 [Asparagus officinalis]